MIIQDLIKLLRDSIFIQDPDIAVVDEDLLSMRDEDFIPILQMCLGRVDPSANLYDLDNSRVYPLITLSKIELYHRLSVKTAPKYSITSATGVQLKKADVFDHYYKLIEQTQKEYNNFMSTGGLTLSSKDITTNVLLDSRYFSQRNYSMCPVPKVKLNIDEVYSDKVELSWGNVSVTKFAYYEIYLSTSPIYDKYDQTISAKATKVIQIKDNHINLYRITGLNPDTKYYVLILIEERNGLKGIDELSFTTEVEVI